MAPDEGSSPLPEAVKKPRGELFKRIVSAIVLIPVALATAYAGGWTFALFWLAAGIAMMVEWTNMTAVEPRRLVQTVLGLGLAGLTVIFLWDMPLLAGLAVIVLALLLGAALTRGPTGRLWAVSGLLYGAVIVLVPP